MLRSTLAATAMTVILSAPALAQQEQNPDQPMPAQQPAAQGQAPSAGQPTQEQSAGAKPKTSQAASDFIAKQKEGQLLATELMDASVIDADGNDIGDIQDFIVDPEGGIDGVVVGVGGFLGVGAKQVALPWNVVQHAPEEQVVNLDVTRAQLEETPDFRTLADIRAEEEAAAAEQQRQMMQQQQGGGGMAPTAPPATQ